MSALALTDPPILRWTARRSTALAAIAAAVLLATPLCVAAADGSHPLHGQQAASPAGPMPASCPLHAAHQSAGRADEQHRHEVDARGDVAMGFSQQATEHHFRLTAEGGAIEVTARDSVDTATRDAVRRHLQTIAVAFAEGDFAIPQAVHVQTPPGVAGMRIAGAVSYRYEELPAGGRVVLAAATPEALGATHEFLRFQIAEHGTGDPVAIAP